MRTALTVCTLLLFVLSGFGGTLGHNPPTGYGRLRPVPAPTQATPTTTTATASNASLNGAYSWEMHGGHENFWGQNLVCGGNPVFMGGTDVREQAVSGTANFDGAGNVSGSVTLYGQLDQNSSNATVSCASNGNAVYFPPCTGTFSGTYSIQSNGSGTMAITASGLSCSSGGNNPGFLLQLAGQCSSGLSNTVFMILPKPNNAIEQAGIARFQSTC